jgi:hypothetical protein
MDYCRFGVAGSVPSWTKRQTDVGRSQREGRHGTTLHAAESHRPARRGLPLGKDQSITQARSASTSVPCCHCRSRLLTRPSPSLPHTLLLERDGKEVRCRVEERGQDESTKIGHGKEKAELEDGIPAHQIIDWWLLASSPLVLRRYI